MDQAIPFNRPFLAGRELQYIAQAAARDNISGDGHFTERCSRLLQQRFGIHRVLMTPSCTAALELAALLAKLKPGDEVLLPSFTFVSTANSVVRLGCRPVFVDIDPDTLNIDPDRMRQSITQRSRAVIPVHYAGLGCEMSTIMKIAREHDLVVIEDAAQAVGGSYNGLALGSIGDLGCYSFHETKNLTCGMGGALCINRPELVARAEILRDKGTNRKQYFRGEVDEYTWVDVGSAYVPSEIACAFLCAQLEMIDAIQARRKQIHATYRQLLQPLADEGLLRFSQQPEECVTNHHIFCILLESQFTRDALLQYLNQNGINAVFHYVPLHSSPMGKSFGYRESDLPITENTSRTLLRLPVYYELSEAKQQRVVRGIFNFFRDARISTTTLVGASLESEVEQSYRRAA